MKTQIYTFSWLRKSLIAACFIFPFMLHGQLQVKDFSDERVLWEPFWPWADSVLVNDSLPVDIDTAFSAAEKQAIKNAIDRWNAAGCQPPMKVNGPTAPVQVNKGDLPAGNPGKTTQNDSNPKDGEAESAEVILDPGECNGISLEEVAVHELGHVLGLGHTNGAADAMKPEGTNGTNGALSDHDKEELKTVSGQYAVALPRDGAEAPLLAIMPGVVSQVQFDLLDYYPAEVIPLIQPIVQPYFDENMEILQAHTFDHLLNVELMPLESHWSGTFYLLVHLLPPAPHEPTSFLGYFYIDPEPVPRVSFECPFEIYEENGMVHVNWTELCTYPFENDLNSVLIIDENAKLSPKNGKNYIFEIEPGTHTFELFVDDYQVNSASSSQVFLVTGLEYPLADPFSFEAVPNPFTNSCTFKSDRVVRINIFDEAGRQVESLSGKSITWVPSPALESGIYYIHAIDRDKAMIRKVVYLK